MAKTMMASLCLFCVALCALLMPSSADQPFVTMYLGLRPVYNMSVVNPGLLNLGIKKTKNSKDISLLASTFQTSINSKDKAFVINNLKDLSKTEPQPIPTSFYWPKDITQLPEDAFDFFGVSVPDGAPITGKADGRVLIVDLTDPNFQHIYDITSPKIPTKKTFQFGRVFWVDLGGLKNKNNFIVCRYSSGQELLSQLVFYERPSFGNELSKPWEEIILKENACDGNMAGLYIRQSREDWEIVFATGRITKSLNLFWPEKPRGGLGWWNDPAQVRGLVLEKGREYYDVVVADLNKDNVGDVVVTVLGNKSDKSGSLEVWEIDHVNFRNIAGYTRHVIASGFGPKTTSNDARSPGSVKVFYPTADQSGKPWILLSGGDDGRAYYFVPTSQDKFNWVYEQHEVPLGSGVQSVTGVEAADVDNDGFADVFVSIYNQHIVRVFTFQPEPYAKAAEDQSPEVADPALKLVARPFSKFLQSGSERK